MNIVMFTWMLIWFIVATGLLEWLLIREYTVFLGLKNWRNRETPDFIEKVDKMIEHDYLKEHYFSAIFTKESFLFGLAVAIPIFLFGAFTGSWYAIFISILFILIDAILFVVAYHFYYAVLGKMGFILYSSPLDMLFDRRNNEHIVEANKSYLLKEIYKAEKTIETVKKTRKTISKQKTIKKNSSKTKK